MTREQQAAVYLRVRDEFGEIKSEQAAISSELKRLGNSLVAIGKLLLEKPLDWDVDIEVLCSDVRDAHIKAQRFQVLAWDRASKKTELEGFNEFFPPLE